MPTFKVGASFGASKAGKPFTVYAADGTTVLGSGTLNAYGNGETTVTANAGDSVYYLADGKQAGPDFLNNPVPTAAQNATAIRANLDTTPINVDTVSHLDEGALNDVFVFDDSGLLVTSDTESNLQSNKLLRAGIDPDGQMTVDGQPFGAYPRTGDAIGEYDANA